MTGGQQPAASILCARFFSLSDIIYIDFLDEITEFGHLLRYITGPRWQTYREAVARTVVSVESSEVVFRKP